MHKKKWSILNTVCSFSYMMNYSDFLKAVKKMGTDFPIPNLGKRTRNGRPCFFTVSIKNDSLYIRNKFGENKPYLIDEDFYNAVLKHFEKASNELRFKPSHYTDPNWKSSEGNPSRIYAGYLPALFRELFTREGISVIDDITVWEEISYSPSDIKTVSEQTQFSSFLEELEKLKECSEIKNLLKKFDLKIAHKDEILIISSPYKQYFISRKEFDRIRLKIEGKNFNSWFSKILFFKKTKKLKGISKRILIEILITIIKEILNIFI